MVSNFALSSNILFLLVFALFLFYGCNEDDGNVEKKDKILYTNDSTATDDKLDDKNFCEKLLL